MSDLLIRNGLIVDGSAQESFQADLLIRGGKIFKIGSDLKSENCEILEASGLVVIPGIIDGHSHTERTIFRNPYSDSKLFQGVTSEVICQCGEGAFPLPEDLEKRNAFSHLWTGAYSGSSSVNGPSWTDFASYAEALADLKPAVNLLPVVPHGALRAFVMGWEERLATEPERKKLQKALAENLSQGAWGISFGLEYPPSSYSDQLELLALAQTIASCSGVCAFHLRNEDNELLESIDEVLGLGKVTGAPIHICHLKADGKPNWGKAIEGLEKIRQSRTEGVRATVDQYPYDAFSTQLSLLIGGWAQSGGREAFLARLSDPNLQERIENEVKQNIDLRGGPGRIQISQTNSARRDLCGKTIEKLAAEMDITAAKVVIQLILEERGGIWGTFFGMDSVEVDYLLSQPDVAIISDGFGLRLPEDGKNSYHPRSFGSFPRVLGRKTRDENRLSLELAVYKMTGLNADIWGIEDRGRLKVGLAADITIFDPQEISDLAGFSETGPYSTGVKYVLVNGSIALKNGKIQEKRNGHVLKRSVILKDIKSLF